MRRILILAACLLLIGAKQPEVETDVDQLISQSAPTLWLDPDSPVELEPDRHFLMDDNAASTAVVDKSGNANGTAARNTADFDVAAGSCKVGTCLDFNGSTDEVDTGSDVIGTGDDSVCAWIYVDGDHEAGTGPIASNGKFYLMISNANPATVKVYCNGATGLETAGIVADGEWTHVCATRTAAGIAQNYVNGAAYGASGSCGTPAGGNTNVIIGANDANTLSFNGKIDDVRIYSRALTPTEVSRIYNAGAGHQLQSTGVRDAIVVDASKLIGSWQSRGSVTSFDFLHATDANKPGYAIPTGAYRYGATFDGTADNLASATALSSVFGASAKTIFIVYQSDAVAADGPIFNDTGSKFSIKVNSDEDIVVTNDDGAADAITITNATAVSVLAVWHDGTNLYAKLGNAAASSAASGATSDLTGTLRIGTDGSAFHKGNVRAVAAYNKVLATSAISAIIQGLCRKHGANC